MSMYSFSAIILIIFFLFPHDLVSQERPSLRDKYPIKRLDELFTPYNTWHPYPTVEDRYFWESLPVNLRRQLISRGEALFGEAWQPIPATVFMVFYRTGSKVPYKKASFGRRNNLRDLVLAECAGGQGRFLDDIVNGIWAICEESSWGNSTNTWLQAPIEDQIRFSNMRLQQIRTLLPDITKSRVDLWVGETAGLLAWTYYLLGTKLDAVSPLVRERILLEVDRRVLAPCLEREFKWMREKGNWNTWITSNWLSAVLLLEQDKNRRFAALDKIFRSIDYFLQKYPYYGSSHEGPGYWRHAAASLFDSLELLHNISKGKIDIFDVPLVQNMGRYIYRVHIADRYFMNFADAPGKIDIPAELVVRYGRSIRDSNLVALGLSALQDRHHNMSGSLRRMLPAIVDASDSQPYQAKPPLIRDAWLPDIQVMAARSQGGTASGFFLGAKGGNNGEGHNHNDVGNFIVFADGHPVLIDVGPETYTAKNSSPQRYDIWTMQSTYHNLPVIGGVMQHHGRKYAARDVVYTAEDAFVRLSMDIAGAYPPEAGLASWQRILKLNRGSEIILTENYHIKKAVEEITMNFMTPCKVRQLEPGILELLHPGFSRPVLIRFESQKLRVSLDHIALTDNNLQTVWGKQLTRIVLIMDKPQLKDKVTIRFLQP